MLRSKSRLLIRSRYAKQAPAELRQNFSALVREEFRNVYKVWSSFVKFIRVQVQGKQKIVDTTFIGYLHKKDDEAVTAQNLELLPSQEFVEAGKFKIK